MNSDPNNPLNLDSREQRVEDALASLARRTAVPAGLADRVFDATASMLPRESGRLVFPNIAAMRSTAWARLALAACVLVVTGVGVWVMQPITPEGAPGGTKLAAYDRGIDELAALPSSAPGSIEGDVAYLLDSNDVTSFDMIRNEMVTMVASLESM